MIEENDRATWLSPLPDCTWSLPVGKYHPAGFGARRKYNLHTGIDLFCEHMQPVASVEAGTIISLKDFSKRKNKSPWLNRTRVILIEGKTGVSAYCNVIERKGLKVGDEVRSGEIIGNVVRLNKKKRRKDVCMLHLELYAKGTRKRVTWSYNFPKPPQLLDPSKHLLGIITDSQVVYKRRVNSS
jgi:hypothetical protein